MLFVCLQNVFNNFYENYNDLRMFLKVDFFEPTVYRNIITILF